MRSISAIPRFGYQCAMIIRDENEQDCANIAQGVELAFGQAQESRLVEQLRRDGDAVISLVAERQETVVGHIMLSAMSAPFRALGLAPLSILPEYQKQGIGAALVTAAIKRAGREKCSAIFVLGDAAYYSRFGFRSDLAAGFSSPYAGPHLMALPLEGELPAESGRIDYAPAFDGLT